MPAPAPNPEYDYHHEDPYAGMTPDEKATAQEEATIPGVNDEEAPAPAPADPLDSIGYNQIAGIPSYDTESQYGEQSLYDLRDHGLGEADFRKFRKEFDQQTAGRQGSPEQRRKGWMDFLATKMHTAARAKAGLTGDVWEKAKEIRDMTQEGREGSPWEMELRKRYANTIREAYGRASRAGGDRAAMAREIGRAASQKVPTLEKYIQQTREAERQQAILSLDELKSAARAQGEAEARAKAEQFAAYQEGIDARNNQEVVALLSLIGTGLGAGVGFAFGGGPAGAAVGAGIGGSIGAAAGEMV